MSTRAAKRTMMQFSLRSLLLAMTLVGVGLVMYRWPWVETKEIIRGGEPTVITTTYRRGWNGEPLQHGMMRLTEKSVHGHVLEIFHFADYDSRGQLISKTHFNRSSQQHGAAVEERGADWGDYREGKKQGIWSHREEDTIIQQSFHQGVHDGPWKWIKAGQVAQTARFDRGRVVAWNGDPIHKALERWCGNRSVDAGTRAALQTPLSSVDLESHRNLGDGTWEWSLKSKTHEVLLHNQKSESSIEFDKFWGRLTSHVGARETFIGNWGFVGAYDNDDPNAPFGELLLKHAFIRQRVVEYRFGVLCFVPFTELQPPEVDVTGISAVSFPPHSAAETAWCEPVVDATDRRLAPLERFRAMFASTPIKFEGPNLPVEIAKPGFVASGDVSISRRSRRDILGLILYANRWSCQQRGNVLESLPHATK